MHLTLTIKGSLASKRHSSTTLEQYTVLPHWHTAYLQKEILNLLALNKMSPVLGVKFH